MKIKDNEYPNYFQAADTLSKKAQKTYLRFVKFDLCAMVIGSALAIYNYQSHDSRMFVYIISGVLLLIATILTLVLKSVKYEDSWYLGRALAESCKTLTWRYMMCSESFEHTLSTQQANQAFSKRIKEVADEFKDLNKEMNARLINKPVISDKMKSIRVMNTQERKDYYVQFRIEDQKEWYADNAAKNKANYELWFWIVIATQILALLCVGYLIINPDSNWNLTGLITTLSASAFSWLQLKNFQELKQAYTTTTGELNHILQDTANITDDASLAKFVLDSENAISREHTMWLAQKRKL
jgi:hypothetical protein